MRRERGARSIESGRTAARWETIAGPGTLGASYLPCCAARLVGTDGDAAALGRLALLWSERASALRFRRAVLAMDGASQPVELALLQRQVWAWHVCATRLQGTSVTRLPWLVAYLLDRTRDPAIGAVFAAAAADLTVLLLGRLNLPSSFVDRPAQGVERPAERAGSRHRGRPA